MRTRPSFPESAELAELEEVAEWEVSWVLAWAEWVELAVWEWGVASVSGTNAEGWGS